MLNGSTQANKKLFTEDELHLNEKGYDLWKKIFRENLDEIF